MTIYLFAPRNRATSITTIAVLAVTALLVVPSTSARAASGHSASVLAQGAGMGAQPSAQVRVVQRALHRRGYDLGAPGIDGRFGPLTAAAVRQMQADHGLAVDGIVGPHTRKALRLTRHAAGLQLHDRKHRSNRASKSKQIATQGRVGHADLGGSSRDESMTLSYSGVSWLDSFLAGALGGLIAALSAVAISAVRRRRAHASTPTRPSGVPGPGAAPAPRNGDEPAHSHATQHANASDQAPLSTSNAAGEQPPSRLPRGHRVIGYVTVSAQSAVNDDHGAAAAIEAVCARSGWELLEIVRDRDVGPTLERPALGYALERIADGKADGMVVSDLQRLSRSIVDLGALMSWFRDAQASLIALDLDIDTSTPKGHRVASTLIALSNHAHERMAHRNRGGGAGLHGNRRTGQPAVRDHPELFERIAAMRAANMTLQAIADQLNEEGVATLRGGRTWRPSSIQAALGYRRPAPRDHLPSLEERKARS